MWTWTALCADWKLIVGYHVGTRDSDCAHELMRDLASRISTRARITTDGHRAYLSAVDEALGMHSMAMSRPARRATERVPDAPRNACDGSQAHGPRLDDH